MSRAYRRNACWLLLRKSEENRSLKRPRCGWIDSIKMDLADIECGGMEWIGLAKDRDQWRALVNAVTDIRGPPNAGKFFSSCTTSGLSSRAQLHGVSCAESAQRRAYRSPSKMPIIFIRL
jgi:hypothetical protein